MNIREAGAQGARRFTAAITVAAAALASIIGVSVWAGTAAAAFNGQGVVGVATNARLVPVKQRTAVLHAG